MVRKNILENFMTSLLNSLFGVIIFVLSLLAFNMPYEFAIVPKVAALLPIFQRGCGALLIICFVLLYGSRLRVFRDNWYLLALAGFLAVLIYSTVINQVDLPGALSDSGLFALANGLLFAVFLKVNPRRYLLILFFVYFLINIANTYTVFATAGRGMWHDWQGYMDPTYSLVGNYNLGIMYVMPMAIAGTVWASKYGRWLQILNYIAIIMSMVMAWKCSSDTQLIIYGLMIVVLFLNDIMHAFKGLYMVLRIFNSAVFIAIDLVLFYLVVMANKAAFIAKIGYEGDFHGRYNIWEVSKSWILQKPIFGNGVETLDYTASKWMPYTDAGHSHCFFLEVPYKTGIVGTVIFAIMLVLVIIAIFRARNIHVKWLLSAMLGLTYLAGIVESYPVVFMITVLSLCYYIAHSDRDEAIEAEQFKQRINARYRRTEERKKTRYANEYEDEDEV